jgi:hypothetical protein
MMISFVAHSSKSFHNENLQMTGFRGSKYGPVMNGAGIVLKPV